jgi:hypothetical protein
VSTSSIHRRTFGNRLATSGFTELACSRQVIETNPALWSLAAETDTMLLGRVTYEAYATFSTGVVHQLYRRA